MVQLPMARGFSGSIFGHCRRNAELLSPMDGSASWLSAQPIRQQSVARSEQDAISNRHVMKNTFIILIASLITQVMHAHPTDVYREINVSTEKSLRVKISGSFETVYLLRGPSNKVVTISRRSGNHDNDGVAIEYSIVKGVGYLEIDLDESNGSGYHAEQNPATAHAQNPAHDRDDWYLTFTDAIPIDFDLEFDIGKADINLSGLKVSRLALETGASKVHLRSTTVNSQVLDRISIEAGVGKFSSDRLGNLNFNVLDFEGGLGDYRLDVTGELRPNAKINAEVGMGALTIRLPKNLRAKLYCDDHWFNSCNLPRFFNRGDGIYETKNFASKGEYVTLKTECAVGSIRIKWEE